MRLRPVAWFIISLLCFAGALYFWGLGDKWSRESAPVQPGTAAPPASVSAPQASMGVTPIRLLSSAGTMNIPPVVKTNHTPQPVSPTLRYRVSNTAKTLKELIVNDRAILLENALLDTAQPTTLSIPQHLRAQGDPGAWIVQSRGALDQAFRRELAAAGAAIVSYIPNNAYLVTGGAGVASRLQGLRQTQAVLPYEPYYKLKADLLALAAEQRSLPDDSILNVLVFANAKDATIDALAKQGAEVLREEVSPFGPLLKVRTISNGLSALAVLPGVQIVELARERVAANDLSRARVGVTLDSVTGTNYLGLTGKDILVNINDTGVDTNHPALAGRVLLDVLDLAGIGGTDDNGHGTHVAGIIAGDGAESLTVTNAEGSIMPPTTNQFRGKAPAAKLYSLPIELERLPLATDNFLQSRAAATNALISNNSWHYRNSTDYDLAAASYDAAVRDSLPLRSGSQSLLYVFAAGNTGDGGEDGQAGDAGSIQSPATAKNVITVGAIEQVRDITNEVWVCTDAFGNTTCVTNSPWEFQTDFDDEVAFYSSRGNVGIGIEGDSGRFKPDVVAPGTTVVSTRSTTWDEVAYYGNTNTVVNFIFDQWVNTNELHTYSLFVPETAIEVVIRAEADLNLDLPIYLRRGDIPTLTTYDYLGTNVINMPRDTPIGPRNSTIFYGIGTPIDFPVRFRVVTSLVLTNNAGNYSEVLSNLNTELGPYYRYESGTSMAAGSASGLLALMHDFFTHRLGRTNSPALMKALLINGARPTGPLYDLNTLATLNLQGWGTINLTNSLPGGLSNLVTQSTGPAPMVFFDQNPTNALATGDSITRNISLSSSAQNQPLRVTLVWTDPPGNPSASLKLVNNLDLVVTNLTTGEVYFGNDIPNDSNFNAIWDTNGPPTLDRVNNVENVYLSDPLGSNYSVTVIARNVNVNAVTAHPDNVVQDYALVISSGNGRDQNEIRVIESPKVSQRTSTVFAPTNSFANNPRYTGSLLMNERVGASTPLLGTNTLPLAGSNPNPWQPGNGVLTIGMTNQWKFYVLTNSMSFTNAAFITFLPPNLALPRMGVFEEGFTNATRLEADIDLYVSTDPRLVLLDPAAIAAADKSLGRGGTEFVAYSNAAPAAVYFVAVKAEDQQAAEYSFMGIFSLDPFSNRDANGNLVVNFFPVPATIPDGSPMNPGGVPVLGLATEQVTVRRAVAYNIVQHENFGDTVGVLNHSQISAVLNNHKSSSEIPLPPGQWELIYEDTGELDLPPSPTTNAIPDFQMNTDGPGSLKDFMGEEGLGVWTLFMIDNGQTQTGRVDDLKLVLEPQNIDDDGDVRALAPGAFTFDVVDVPPEATNLIICVTGNTDPVELYVARDGLPSRTIYNYFKIINAPGGCLSISPYDLPPLMAGRYYIGVFNPSTRVQNIRIIVTIERNPFAVSTSISSPAGAINITDDAVTYAFITNGFHIPITTFDVGMLINHPRISDLAITLISPNGTRSLLFEDRGAWATSGLGSFGVATNALGEPGMLVTNLASVYTNSFEAAAPGVYVPGTVFEGWHVLSNEVLVIPDFTDIVRSNNVLVLGDGGVSNSLPTTSPSSYTLDFKVTHAPFLVGTIGWWPLDGNGSEIVNGLDGFFSGEITPFSGKVGQCFFGNGVRSSVTVPACPAIDVGQDRGFTLEGWIFPVVNDRPSPLIEWAGPFGSTPGVQFRLVAETNSLPGSLAANIYDTNGAPHLLETAALVITNLGWQHVALTYDATTAEARIYVNGQVAAAQVVGALGALVPQTSYDLYFGFRPGTTNADLSFMGGLDEIGLYSRALAGAEVGAIHRAGSRGKYGTNVLTSPVALELTLLNPGPVTYAFTNGLSWTNGPAWETNHIEFTTATSNATTFLLRPLDPNVTVDEFVLSTIKTSIISGFFHFSENTNEAYLPVKYAPTPYRLASLPPTLIFTNDFETATQGIYTASSPIPGSPNRPGIGMRDWTVTPDGAVTVLSNRSFAAAGTNSLVLSTNRIETTLPTTPGNRYQLTYQVRGPAAVGWWNGGVDPYSRRALDLIGGNHGAFIYPATTNPANAAVGSSSLAFGIVDNAVGKIEMGDPDRLRLTNALTIEGWIYPTNTPAGLGQILFRGDMRACLDPYYLAMTSDSGLRFHVEDGSGVGCGVNVSSRPGAVELRKWQHVAAVFEAGVPYKGDASLLTNEMRLFFNGVPIATNYTFEMPFEGLKESYSPGVAIGNRSRSDISEPFLGYIDELTVYARALTTNEIVAIAGNGPAGKSDAAAPASQSLAKVHVLVDNLLLDAAYAENASWTTRTFSFTATRTNSLLAFQGLLPGTILEGMSLTELPSELRYLPEQSMKKFEGEDAYGVWALEILDTRAGGTNITPQLVNWQLNFVMMPSSPPPVVSLVHGMPYTNTLRGREVQHIRVQVPAWASFATNILLMGTNATLGRTANVGVLYDRTNYPFLPVNALFWPPVDRGTNVLGTNTATAQYIVPGETYYLTVTNPNIYAATFALGVWFDITPLTNCQPLTSWVGPAGIPRYFQFDVPDEAVLPGEPKWVSFWLSGVQSNVTVVLSQHLPLPDFAHADYISEWPCTNNEVVMLVTNTTPFPIPGPSRWYVGVFNTTATNVPFTVQACYATNSPVVIPLTNSVPFVVLTPTNDFAAPPGPPQLVFFEFEITNYTPSVLFELYGLSGNADLVLQRDLPPVMAPYFRSSYREGTTPEQIVLRPNYEFPDLRGKWYLGIYNLELTNVAYTIRASLPTNGFLLSGQPIEALLTPLLAPRGLRVRWNAVEGEPYVIEFSPSIINPTWTPIGPAIIATTPFPAVEVPTPLVGNGFFRVSQATRAAMPNAPIRVTYLADGRVRIAWPIFYFGYRLQYTYNFMTWYDADFPTTIEGNEWVGYDVVGTTPRFYRVSP